MSDQKSKLEALEGILGVDETDSLERPEPRRGIGDVLSSGAERAESAAETRPPSSDAGAPRPETPPTAPAKRVVKAAASATPRRAATEDRLVVRRTSASLPVDLDIRFDAAKERRWAASDVIVSAIENQVVGDSAADDVLKTYDSLPRSVRSYRLTVGELEHLDDLGRRWRMNRSQVLTVLLHGELTRLGF